MGRFVRRIVALAWVLAGGVLFTLRADETPMEPTERSESADAEPVSPDPATPTKPLLPRLEDLAWTKGSYRIVPYGIGWLNVAFDTARTTPGPFALYVASRADEGEPQFSLNAQSTRFGLDVSGPEVRTFATSGRIEFDFHGHALFENRASVLMRHAYGELKNDNWRILGGQTNDVISPLAPNVLNYTVGWAAGNIGYRRAQVRVERFLRPSDVQTIWLQGSINQSVVSDFAESTTVTGEDAGWPDVMTRVAIGLGERRGQLHPLELGISGHIGQEGIDFVSAPAEDDRRFATWSANLDVRYAITDRLGVQGEWFLGQALGTFFGGINQGIDPVNRVAIRSIGGWVEIWYDFSDRWHGHWGAGIDDPRNEDLSAGRRTLNEFCFGNVVFDIAELFNVGFELSWRRTDYFTKATGRALRSEAVMRYRF